MKKNQSKYRAPAAGRSLFLGALLTLIAMATTQAAEPNRIGLTLGLTGKDTNLGVMLQRGQRLWERNINQKGGFFGRPVEVIIIDDESDPKKAPELYQTLIKEDRVDLVFGPYSSAITLAGGSAKTQCQDRIDNDGDGFCDFFSKNPNWCRDGTISGDPDCDSKSDNDEFTEVTTEICMPMPEICDGIDNNCNNQIDEGGVCISPITGCGNAVIELGEICDSGSFNGIQGQCNATCSGYESITGNVIRVGPTRLIKTPSEASTIVSDGDIVEIDAGEYINDASQWRANNIILRGVGGKVHLKMVRSIGHKRGDDQNNGKAIWVIKGNNNIVENIEFSGARVRDKNGAGIRAEGSGLLIGNSYFHDNQMGFLSSSISDGDFIIENSEFDNNGIGNGFTHNIYIASPNARFILRNSYSHRAIGGQLVKTRAKENYIMYNRLMDETGNSSYVLDVSNGGLTYVIGNIMHQGPNAVNWSMIAYAAEGGTNPLQELYVINNTMVNERSNGRFFRRGEVLTQLTNNILTGSTQIFNSGSSDLSENLITSNPDFVNQFVYDYHLTIESPAIDSGFDPGSTEDISLVPNFQYVYDLQIESRPTVGQLDMGAFEY